MNEQMKEGMNGWMNEEWTIECAHKGYEHFKMFSLLVYRLDT